MDNLPTASHRTPDPCQILAGLSVQYGVTPDQIEPWASRLASECPSWAAGHETGIVRAYFKLAGQGNGSA